MISRKTWSKSKNKAGYATSANALGQMCFYDMLDVLAIRMAAPTGCRPIKDKCQVQIKMSDILLQMAYLEDLNCAVKSQWCKVYNNKCERSSINMKLRAMRRTRRIRRAVRTRRVSVNVLRARRVRENSKEAFANGNMPIRTLNDPIERERERRQEKDVVQDQPPSAIHLTPCSIDQAQLHPQTEITIVNTNSADSTHKDCHDASQCGSKELHQVARIRVNIRKAGWTETNAKTDNINSNQTPEGVGQVMKRFMF